MLRHLAQRGTRSAAGANSRFQLAQRLSGACSGAVAASGRAAHCASLSARCKSDDTDDTHPDFQPARVLAMHVLAQRKS